jgi:phosphotransferase system IIB component
MILNYELISMIIGIVVLLIGFMILSKRMTQKKHAISSTSLPVDFLERLVKAVGTEHNIKSISREHQRIKLVVYDLKVVSGETLKQLGTPAFLKGKELTLLVKHHTKDVIDYINTLKREGN